MIDHVSVYMYVKCRPFVYIHQGDRLRCYNLTKASAWRLAWACWGSGGWFRCDGQGWHWTRMPKPGYSEGCLDSGVPLIE